MGDVNRDNRKQYAEEQGEAGKAEQSPYTRLYHCAGCGGWTPEAFHCGEIRDKWTLQPEDLSYWKQRAERAEAELEKAAYTLCALLNWTYVPESSSDVILRAIHELSAENERLRAAVDAARKLDEHLRGCADSYTCPTYTRLWKALRAALDALGD